jgi:hypothetical protein
MPEPLLSEQEQRRGIALARRGPRAAADLAALFDRVRSRVVERVDADDRVRELHGRGRVHLVGADYDEDKPDGDWTESRRLGRVYYYDYEAGSAVAVTTDLRSGEVLSVDARRGVHLRPSEGEIEEARSLVLDSKFGRQVGGREISLVAFPGRTVDEDDPTWTHRRIDLHFWSNDEPPIRLVSAVVDLTDRRVLPFTEDLGD